MVRLFVCLLVCSVSQSAFAQPGTSAPDPQDDAQQQLVAVRVAILESGASLPLKEATNLSAADLDEFVAKLKGAGNLRSYQYFTLSSLENQQAMIQFGQEENVISGQAFSSARGGGPGGFSSGGSSSNFGRVSNVYQREQTGSIVSVVSRVREDGQIIVELGVNSTRLQAAKSAQTSADPADVAAQINPPQKTTLTFQTTVLLSPGVATVIAAGGNDDARDSSRDYIIVSAKAK